MKRNMRVIQISGISGILTAVFFISCLAAGFVVFPAFAAMKLWNFAASYFEFPAINIYQGLMLWAAVALSVMIINNKKKYLTSFNCKTQLSEEEICNILARVRKQAQINSMLINQNKEISKEKDKENV